MLTLAGMARRHFEAGPSMLALDPPVIIMGDVHGQFAELIEVLLLLNPD